MTELNVSSRRDNQPVYFFSFAQVRIVASSSPNSLALLGHGPKQLPKEDDWIKTTVSNTKGAKLDITLSATPNITPGVSAGQTTVLEKVRARWTVTSQGDADVDEAVPPMGLCFAVWKYVHNDDIFDRREEWCFEPDHCPSALFRFEQIETGVQVEILIFWSLDKVPSKRREFPIAWPWGKEHRSIYQNFLHQAEASVGLEKVPQSRSWTMPNQKAHVLTREELDTSKGPIHFQETIATAKVRSESNNFALTNCEVTMKTAVKGKVSLTEAERTSDSFIFRVTIVGILNLDFVIDRSALTLQPPGQTATGLNSTASSSSSTRREWSRNVLTRKKHL